MFRVDGGAGRWPNAPTRGAVTRSPVMPSAYEVLKYAERRARLSSSIGWNY